MLSFDFLEKSLGLVSPPYILRMSFFMLYSINGPNFIVLLPSPLEILGDICVAITFLTVCDTESF